MTLKNNKYLHMKTKIYFFLTLLIITVSCNKSEEVTNSPNTNGNYTGIFERNGIISNVNLNLVDGSFNGQSATQKYPALCNGTYLISGNTITFDSNCAWTADFDWSLILDGEWNYNMNGNILILTKSNGDKYTLTQQ
jgi:hypothetical protein